MRLAIEEPPGETALTTLPQRRPTSGISSIASKLARPAQRKSKSGMADQTCCHSICRETYQKHAPVTTSLAATNATFSALPRRDARGVSKSLVRLVLIWLSLLTQPTVAMTCPGSLG